MFIGQTILKDQSVFTPWIQRQADNAIFTWEAIQLFGGTSIDVKVFSKAKEDSGEGAEVGPSSWTSSGSLRYSTFTGLLEMIRFKVSASGGAAGGIYRLLEPTWFDDAN